MVTIPLDGWTGRGGMPVGIALTFNSQSVSGGGSGGYKWTSTYDTVINGTSGTDATITWGDGRSYTFHRNTDGSYAPPTGIYDTLTYNGSSESFDLTTKGQTVYHFGNWGGGTNLLGSIVDQNGNTITLTRSGYGSRVSTVTDPTGRTLGLSYDGSGRLTYVTDHQTQNFWSLGYNSNGDLVQINWPALNGVIPNLVLAYDGNHNLNSFSDLNRNVAWTAAYDSSNRLSSETDACGNSTGFGYSGGTVVTDPNGNVTTYTYAGAVLRSVTDATNKTETFGYDVNNNLTSQVDRRGKVWTYTFDTKHGNAQISTDPLGNSATAIYDARNSKTLQTTDALGHSTTFVYDGGGVNLLATTDALGDTSTINGYSYGLPTSVSDALGETSTMGYDANGDLIQATDPNGNSSSATYNSAGWELTATDPLGQTTGYRYDAWGRVTSVEALPAAGVPFYRLNNADGVHMFLTSDQAEYNRDLAWGGMIPLGPVGGIYANSTDAAGTTALYRLFNPNNGVHYYTTDAQERANAIQLYGFNDEGITGYAFTSAAAGRKPVYLAFNTNNTQFLFTDDSNEYNALAAPWQQLGVKFYLAGNTVSTTYDANGNVLTVTDPDGNTVTNTYDADNRPVFTTKGNGDTVTYTYDDATRRGQVVFKVDGNGNALNHRYTPRGELAGLDYPDGTSENFGYDENGDLLTRIKRDGSVITYGYDADSRLVSTTYPGTATPTANGTDPGGTDPGGTDPGGTDPGGTDPGDGSTADAVRRSPPAGPFTFGAPMDITPAATSVAATANVTIGYDAAGRQTSMTDGLGPTTWAYDAGNRLTQLANNYQTLTYQYDAANRLVNKNASNAFTWTYAYDPGGRLTTQGTPQGNVTYQYDAGSRLTRLTKGNGMLTDYGYAADGQATEVFWHWDWSSAVMGDSHYAYAPGGELVHHWDPTDGSDTTYAYDGADQLTSESSDGYSWYGVAPYLLSYDYDRNGNRLHKSLALATGTYADAYAYQQNHFDSRLHTDELLSVTGSLSGTKAFTYDADGDMRSVNANGHLLFLTPDAEDRYTRFDMDTGPGQGSVYAAAQYNGLGARFVRRSADGATHGMAYDGVSPGDALLYDGAGAIAYTPGIAQTSYASGKTLYTNVDALGSVHDTETDGSGGPADVLRTEAFGTTLTASSEPDALSLGWGASSSYQTDSDTGLTLLGNRYYDAPEGRFVSPDPAGAGDNWYAYCGNDPLDNLDPTGLSTELGGPGQDRTVDGIDIGSGPAGRQLGAAIDAANSLYLSGTFIKVWHTVETTHISYGSDGSVTTSVSDGPPQVDGEFMVGGAAQQGSSGASFQLAAGYLGNNLRGNGKTDLEGGRAVAKSIFRHLTRGQNIIQKENRGVIRRFPEGANRPQIRMGPGSKTNLDLPSGEDIHFPGAAAEGAAAEGVEGAEGADIVAEIIAGLLAL